MNDNVEGSDLVHHLSGLDPLAPTVEGLQQSKWTHAGRSAGWLEAALEHSRRHHRHPLGVAARPLVDGATFRLITAGDYARDAR